MFAPKFYMPGIFSLLDICWKSLYRWFNLRNFRGLCVVIFIFETVCVRLRNEIKNEKCAAILYSFSSINRDVIAIICLFCKFCVPDIPTQVPPLTPGTNKKMTEALKASFASWEKEQVRLMIPKGAFLLFLISLARIFVERVAERIKKYRENTRPLVDFRRVKYNNKGPCVPSTQQQGFERIDIQRCCACKSKVSN